MNIRTGKPPALMVHEIRSFELSAESGEGANHQRDRPDDGYGNHQQQAEPIAGFAIQIAISGIVIAHFRFPRRKKSLSQLSGGLPKSENQPHNAHSGLT